MFFYYSFKAAGSPLDLADPSIWRTLVFIYPFVMIPLGLWSPFIGLLVWLLLERVVRRTPRGWFKPAFLGFVLGAMAGAILLGGFYAILGVLLHAQEHADWWALTGAVSGATGGTIVALFFRRGTARFAAERISGPGNKSSIFENQSGC